MAGGKRRKTRAGKAAEGGEKRTGRALGPALLVVLLALLTVSVMVRYGGRVVDLFASSPVGRIGGEERGASVMIAEPPRSMPGDVMSAGVQSAEPHQLSLQILNATGINRLALDTGELLRRWGIDAVDRVNAPAWPFPETLLIVRDGRAEQILVLAERLGGVPVVLQRREDLMLDGTLILGHDWERYHWPAP